MRSGFKLHAGQLPINGGSRVGTPGIGKLCRSNMVFYGLKYANVDSVLVFGTGFGHVMGGLSPGQALK